MFLPSLFHSHHFVLSLLLALLVICSSCRADFEFDFTLPLLFTTSYTHDLQRLGSASFFNCSSFNLTSSLNAASAPSWLEPFQASTLVSRMETAAAVESTTIVSYSLAGGVQSNVSSYDISHVSASCLMAPSSPHTVPSPALYAHPFTCISAFRITPAQPNKVGGVTHIEKQIVFNEFESFFLFRITSPSVTCVQRISTVGETIDYHTCSVDSINNVRNIQDIQPGRGMSFSPSSFVDNFTLSVEERVDLNSTSTVTPSQFPSHFSDSLLHSTYGGNGFAFIIHNSVRGLSAMGTSGGCGYDGIDNSLAIEFDTFADAGEEEGYWIHVSVHTRGRKANDAHKNAALFPPVYINNIKDQQIHAAKIVLYPDLKTEFIDVFVGSERSKNYLHPILSTLCVYLEDMNRPLLCLPLDLTTIIDLDVGTAFVGFTASTGAHYENHDILYWRFCQQIGQCHL